MTSWRGWRDQTVTNIASAMKSRRKALGLTAADLSKRTALFGKPLSGAVISDLETGRKRTLDVTELITLSLALNCSPLSLLFADAALEDVELFPGATVPAVDALSWALGEGLVFRDPNGRGDVSLAGDQVLESALRLASVQLALEHTKSRLREAEGRADAFDDLWPPRETDAEVSQLRVMVGSLTQRRNRRRLEYIQVAEPDLFNSVTEQVFDAAEESEWIWGPPNPSDWEQQKVDKAIAVMSRLLADRRTASGVELADDA